ncbi:histidine kinase [Chitinophaga polysaccharea]|uniref:sensor histidine kinase n=1 Tax=Chitinophaga TaxID=79328 RepID=UPI001455CFDD|nr:MULTISPECIES: histidine kinase [Chitinophaga]NLR62560.1 histidine kinase [Chitinophaga polysaccharea]NLU91506.1 histidine kinase [Chitinophaga sp. Ak27]
MKIFWRYIFPAIYGALVYYTIRLLTDSLSGMRFWHRPLRLNITEVGMSILVAYLFLWLLNVLLRYFDKKWQSNFTTGRIARELGATFLLSIVIQNLFLTPLAALTDDGLQWFDLADINVIPLLYALIYYGFRRSNGYLQAYVQNRLQLEKITNDKLATELKFLKAQYHPHFLFNALNTIYFQMDEDVAAAKKTVERFAELLRYQLYDQQEMVDISSEIQYLRHFIDLQQIRSSSKLQLSVHFDEQLGSQQVYPLLFLPLAENAFKYAGGHFKVNIAMQQADDGILFSVSNDIPAHVPGAKTGGIGLENLKRRLELLYPDKHTLTTQIQDNTFVAALKLTLR